MAFIPTQYNNPVFVYSLRKLVTDYYDPLVRVIRESDFVEVDVLPDSNDEISYDSVIARTSQTAATTLGEFLNIDGYADVDSLGSVYEGRLVKVYDQSAGTFDIEIASYGDAFLFVETNLAEYSGSTAIHKVNGIPTFRPQALTTAFQVANVREREVSYHFLVEGTQSGFFGIVDSSNTLAIQGLHNYTLERTYTSFISPSTPSDWDVNDVYFDSVVSTNITGSLYESNTWNNFDTAIITVEAAIKDNAVTQSAFPDNIATFRLVQNNWYCDLIAFDDYDPIRRLTIEGLYADASSNASAFSRTSKLLLNVEDPTQSGFLAQFPNAAAAYSVRSLRGLTGLNGPKVLRVRREVDNAEVDVYTDSTGWVSLDSPVVIVPAITGQIDGGTGVEIDSLANTLGEFVADAEHDDVDSLGSPTTAKVVVWYDQSSADYTIISEEIDARGAPVRIRVVGGTYHAYEFDLYFDDNESISLSSYVADTYEISDGATQVTANLTLGTLQTLVDAGMTGATVCVWYDQSGNANDATQTTTGSQPKIYDSTNGVIEDGSAGNEKPAIDWNGSSHQLIASVTISAALASTSFVVANPDVVSGNRRIYNMHDGATGDERNSSFVNSQFNIFDGTNGILAGSPSAGEQYIITSRFVTGDGTIHANGTLQGTSAAIAQKAITTLSIGKQDVGADFYFDGKIQEVIIYHSDQDAAGNRTNIESNINTYYDIYGTGNTGVNTPLLDTYSDAVAAYSLRKLRTSYNGPVNLSKRKDAIQNVATAQPTIYNGGLITENGKPAVQFDGVDDRFSFTEIEGSTGMTLISIHSYNFISNDNLIYLGSDTILAYTGAYIKDMSIGGRKGKAQIYYEENGNSRFLPGSDILTNTQYSQFGYVSTEGSGISTNGDLFTGNAGINNLIVRAIAKDLNSYHFNGNIQELIIYPSDQSSNRIDIENNINSAFQIYAANFSSVLDSVPLAKAAYSIRRLTKNYIGPIITVTNGSTTKDFYADFWGNLDVDALTSFANGGTLSVTKWWDQSGREDHLLATATNKPTLTISNGEVSVNTNNKFDTLLLDEYDGAAAAYSLRQIKRSYEGPLVRVRRDGTNTEVDVYPDENLTISLNSPVLNVVETTTGVTVNPLDTLATTLGEFVADAGNDPDGLGATASAFVVVWYDQANSNNASQNISTAQPKIYDSVNGVVLENGKPALYFDGNSDYYQLSYSQGTLSSFLYTAVFAPANTTTVQSIFDFRDANDDGSRILLTSTGDVFVSTDTADATTTYTTGQQLFTGVYDGANLTAYVDGVGGTSITGVDTNATRNGRIGSDNNSLQFYPTGNMQEIILYFNQSSNRTGIETNVNNHYQIPNFNATASTAQTVAVYNNAINTTVDLNATYTDLKEIIKYE